MKYENMTPEMSRALFEVALTVLHVPPPARGSRPFLDQAIIDAITPQVIATDIELRALCGGYSELEQRRLAAADTWKRASEASVMPEATRAQFRAYAAQALKGTP